MTPVDVERLRALCDAATPGPWRVSMSGYSVKSHDVDTPIVATVHTGPQAREIDIERWLPNADFIAAARTAIPALLTSLSTLRAERDELRAAQDRERRHPMAPERCPVCEWTNINLMNYGTPGASNWMCHGCAARRIAATADIERQTAERIAEYATECADDVFRGVHRLSTVDERDVAREDALRLFAADLRANAWKTRTPGGDGG